MTEPFHWTKPRRALMDAVKAHDLHRGEPGYDAHGYRVNGSKWPAINELRTAGLLKVNRFRAEGSNDSIWLVPTEEGKFA